MKRIKIADVVIFVDFIHEDEFKSLSKYEMPVHIFATPKYVIFTDPDYPIVIPDFEPIHTEFYDLYEMAGSTLQVQKENGKITGYILYHRDEIVLVPLVDTFWMEYLLSQYAISYIMSKNNALILHGSSFIYKGMGIILSAKSGTGKSTHSRLWQKYENVVVINDDKNILKIEEDEIICYGSPWSGKHMIDNNTKAPLKAIVFLYQNKDNVIEELTPMEAFKRLIGQLVLPTKENQDLWNKIMDKLISLPVYSLGCNMEIEAYLTLKERLDLLCH